MTALENRIAGGIVGFVIGGAAGVYLGPKLFGPYEDGIRVKNGSVVFVTDSWSGFERRSNRFGTAKLTKGCYDVTVTAGNCTGPSTLAKAARIKIQASDGRWTTAEDQDEPGVGKRFSLDNDNGWSSGVRWWRLNYGNGAIYFAAVDAEAAAGTLHCTATSKDQDMQATLTPVTCQ